MTKSKYESRGDKATRAGFGEALLEVAAQDERIVGLCADLTESLSMKKFEKAYPHRFFNAGIAEANMTGIGAGLAAAGKIPFIATFANFATGRSFDQIRQSVCYSEMNVKICASHAGLTLGEDGATHQILEDIALMRSLPNMTVVVPCDFSQTKRAVHAVAKHRGAVYLRFSRPAMPDFSSDDEPFDIGKAIELHDGNDVTIIACGVMVWRALQAAYQLASENIFARVLNMHTIKPLDDAAILKAAQETGAIVTAEEHQLNGGLSDAVAGVCARALPVPIESVAVMDKFGESGTHLQLLEKYGLTTEHIVQKAKAALKRKK